MGMHREIGETILLSKLKESVYFSFMTVQSKWVRLKGLSSVGNISFLLSLLSQIGNGRSSLFELIKSML